MTVDLRRASRLVERNSRPPAMRERSDSVLSQLFSFSDVVVHNDARVVATDTLRIVAPSQPWAYAAALPVQSDWLRRVGASRSAATIEVRGLVIRGSIGIACLDSRHALIDETIRYTGDGPTAFLLRLDSLADCSSLMVRNGAELQQPSEVVLHSIRVMSQSRSAQRGTYIFDHLFKTGGTTLHQSYLPAAFRATDRFVVRGDPGANDQDLSRLMSLPDCEKRRLRMIAGHHTSRLRSSYPGAKFLTLAREPVQRVISAYLHAAFYPAAHSGIGEYLEAEDIGLARFVQEDSFAKWQRQPSVSVQDWQAKALLGSHSEDIDWQDEEAIKRVIRRRYHLVGYTETLELFLFFLHITEGFPLVLFNNRLVNPKRESFHPSPEDLAIIERHNRADAVVYRCVRQEFDRRVSEIWNAEREQDYREYLQALRRFRRRTGGDVNAVRVFRY